MSKEIINNPVSEYRLTDSKRGMMDLISKNDLFEILSKDQFTSANFNIKEDGNVYIKLIDTRLETNDEYQDRLAADRLWIESDRIGYDTIETDIEAHGFNKDRRDRRERGCSLKHYEEHSSFYGPEGLYLNLTKSTNNIELYFGGYKNHRLIQPDLLFSGIVNSKIVLDRILGDITKKAIHEFN